MHSSAICETVLRHTSYAGAEKEPDRLLFALAGDTYARSVSLFSPEQLPTVDYRWAEPEHMQPGAWERLLDETQPTVLVTGWWTPAIPRRFTDSTESPLRYVCHLAGTVRNLIPRELIERGVMVSNWGACIGQSVAEHALLLVLGLLRNLPAWKPFLEGWEGSHIPRKALRTRSLRGKRVGLHGFGAVARAFAELVQPFDVTLSAYSKGVPESLFAAHGVQRCHTLEELFADSDILIECEALTPDTRETVNEHILRQLPIGAVFVNVGRGPVVEEAALLRVAEERSLRLGLDVYHEEPLAPDSVLHGLSSALLSPHIAGPADDSFPTLWDFAMRNLRRYFNGEAIEGQVTTDVYDRTT